jgi:GAF domain-containing protein
MSLGYSSGGSTQELRIPREFELLRFMEYHLGAQDFPFSNKTNLPASEKEWLSQLGTKLIVPMTGTDRRLAGLLLLGSKKSEVPYTAGDRQLLEILADQVAIVYENVRLKERVDRERRVRHEVLARVVRLITVN